MKILLTIYLLIFSVLAVVQFFLDTYVNGLTIDEIRFLSMNVIGVCLAIFNNKIPSFVGRVLAVGYSLIFLYLGFKGTLVIAKANLPIFVGMLALYGPLPVIIIYRSLKNRGQKKPGLE